MKERYKYLNFILMVGKLINKRTHSVSSMKKEKISYNLLKIFRLSQFSQFLSSILVLILPLLLPEAPFFSSLPFPSLFFFFFFFISSLTSLLIFFLPFLFTRQLNNEFYFVRDATKRNKKK